MHRGQEKDGETAETDRQAIKVRTSSNFENKYYLCLSYQKSVCLCANIVIRINRGSALHEHHTIIFRKSHLGCFDLTDEVIYMSECVDSQRSLLASIRIILYLCRPGSRDVWERGKKRGLVQQREGRRRKEEGSLSVKAAAPDLLPNAWVVKETSHIQPPGGSPRGLWGSPGVSGDLGGNVEHFPS